MSNFDLYLVRHGESMRNTYKEIELPDPDVSLTENGTEQAYKTGIYLNNYFSEKNIVLNNSVMWVSPYKRTIQTSKEILKNLNISTVYEDPRLSERQFGILDGKAPEYWEDHVGKHAARHLGKWQDSTRAYFFSRPIGGESPSDVYNRMDMFISSIHRDEYNPIIVVSHAMALKCLLMRYLHKNIQWFNDEYYLRNCQIIHIYKNEGVYSYEYLN